MARGNTEISIATCAMRAATFLWMVVYHVAAQGERARAVSQPDHRGNQPSMEHQTFREVVY